MSDGGQPIIIQKKKKGHAGHHGGAWKVAYADFVTAMMALFIVLWILGQSEQVKQAVSGYFKDPSGLGSKAGQGMFDKSGTAVIGTNQMKPSAQALKEAERERLTILGKQLQSELSSDPTFDDLKDQIKIEFVQEGLRIELVESNEKVFFDVGTANLNHSALLLLQKIGGRMAKMNNKIIMEGHTDSRPYGDGRGYSNFELSADRANSARRALVSGGLENSKVTEVRGYADSKLRNVKDPYDAVNRRISIIVQYSEK
jgi:chemotaxis protein MotB